MSDEEREAKVIVVGPDADLPLFKAEAAKAGANVRRSPYVPKNAAYIFDLDAIFRSTPTEGDRDR